MKTAALKHEPWEWMLLVTALIVLVWFIIN